MGARINGHRLSFEPVTTMTADLDTATDLDSDEPAPSRALRTVLIAVLVVRPQGLFGARVRGSI